MARAQAPVADVTCAPRSVDEALGCAALRDDRETAWATVFDAAAAASRSDEEAVTAGRHVVCSAPTLDAERAYQLGGMLEAAGDLENAIALYVAIVHARSTGPLAPHAAEQTLHGLSRLARDAGHHAAACYARMDTLATEWLAGSACAAPGASAATCARWSTLRCTIRFHRGGASVETDPARSIELFEQVHALGCAEGDQALFNASVVAERSGDGARARALREELRRAYPMSRVLDRLPP